MPKGKGTYGDQRGRPPKENYEEGGNVEPNFPMENDAISDANKMGQELREISLENVPMSNAQDRIQTMEMGGEVGTGVYAEGGKVIGTGNPYPESNDDEKPKGKVK